MSSIPIVSVVIPAFNAEKFITKTLDTVLAQTYTNYELIVVDDGSNDNTEKVVNEYFTKNKVCGECIRQENKRIAAARNTGIRFARGKFIALLDHDDLWMPEKLQRVIAAFKLMPKTDLICHNEQILQNGKVIKVSQNSEKNYSSYEELLFKGNSLSPSAVVFRKSLFDTVGGFDESPELNTVEDYDFWLRISRVGKITYINATLGSYVLVKSAASNNILYHYGNLGNMLNKHLIDYQQGKKGFLLKLRASLRIASARRAALIKLCLQKTVLAMQQILANKIIRSNRGISKAHI